MTYRKKLIEVALPLEAINSACRAETENPFLKGHPRSIHPFWARQPLVACRAIVFASLVDDPSNDLPEKEALQKREHLFHVIEDLVKWENTGNEEVIKRARKIIEQDTINLPIVMDPFCGRGSIPLEAERIGLDTVASDLNPLAVLITKALTEIPLRYLNHMPFNPKAKAQMSTEAAWQGISGLSADIRYYGKWIQDQAYTRLYELYAPSCTLSSGKTVLAWLWARTVACPNPACGFQVPLVSSYRLSGKAKNQAWVEPVFDIKNHTIHFDVKSGIPIDAARVESGTTFKSDKGKKVKATFVCPVCGIGMVRGDYIDSEAGAGRLNNMPLAKVVQGRVGKTFMPFTLNEAHEITDASNKYFTDEHLLAKLPTEQSRGTFASNAQGRRYGFRTFSDYFTRRQLMALSTIFNLVQETRTLILEDSGGDQKYADSIVTYLALAASRLLDYHSAICTWNPTNENMRNVFVQQGIRMTWDFAEANPIEGNLTFASACEWIISALSAVPLVHVSGHVLQADATRFLPNTNKPTMIFTDPPYYDNISFADLTDFFYVWLRRCLGSIYPDLFSTVLTPKDTELIASPYHFSGDREKADKYFEEGMVRVFVLMKEHADPNYPLVLYYAFKQEEDTKEEVNGTLTSSSTGWEKMLIGLDRAGYQITGTWPIRSTKSVRSVARNANALASAIIIVCRPRPEHAPVATRREFLTAIRKELPRELSALMSGRVAPVDLAQASIGPGMAVFSRYSKVLEADGCAMTVRTALQLINQELDTYLTSQEGELDSDTRFCVSWFEQRGMDEGPYGDAETLAKAKGIAVQGLGDAGIAIAKAGKVRLLKRAELEHNWDPLKESRLTVWGCTQHLIRTLESEGEEAAGHLVTRLGGGRSEEARSLAYRLFAICDKKSWAGEAMAYNALVRAWPEIMRLAQNFKLPEQGQLDIRG